MSILCHRFAEILWDFKFFDEGCLKSNSGDSFSSYDDIQFNTRLIRKFYFFIKLLIDLETVREAWSSRLEWYLSVSDRAEPILLRAWMTGGSSLKCLLTCNIL